MITAIIGPTGAGKTTIMGMLDKTNISTVIVVDDLVRELYERKDVKDYFSKNPFLSLSIKNDKIDRSVLIKILMQYYNVKTMLEDYLMNTFIVPKLKVARDYNENLLIDGLSRRYLSYVDQVIYVEMREEDRLKNLQKRGVALERAHQLISLQEGMFNSILPEKMF